MARKSRPYSDFAHSSAAVPPHWRWLRATALVLSSGQQSRWVDDEPTLRAAAFVRARDRPAGSCLLDPLLAKALGLFVTNGQERWLLEAQILTGTPSVEIAKNLGLEPESVNIYEALFFDVRSRLAQRHWIAAHSFGVGPSTGFKPDDLGSLWRWIGYRYGKVAMDLVHAVTTGIGRNNYTEELLESVELFVELRRLPPNCPPRQVLQLQLRLEVDATGAHASVYHFPCRRPQRTKKAVAQVTKTEPDIAGDFEHSSPNNCSTAK